MPNQHVRGKARTALSDIQFPVFRKVCYTEKLSFVQFHKQILGSKSVFQWAEGFLTPMSDFLTSPLILQPRLPPKMQPLGDLPQKQHCGVHQEGEGKKVTLYRWKPFKTWKHCAGFKLQPEIIPSKNSSPHQPTDELRVSADRK